MKLIFLGHIIKNHALKGYMSLYLENPSSSQISSGTTLYINENEYKVEAFNDANQKKILLKLQGLDSIESIQHLFGEKLFMNRDDFSEGEYLNDLVGMEVYENSHLLGKVEKFYSNGPQEIMVVSGDKNFEYPLLDQFIQNIDYEKKSIEVKKLEYI